MSREDPLCEPDDVKRWFSVVSLDDRFVRRLDVELACPAFDLSRLLVERIGERFRYTAN